MAGLGAKRADAGLVAQLAAEGKRLATVLMLTICDAKDLAKADRFGKSDPFALVTFGEGWHNNHHYYPSSARQGFYWWEIDITYYILRALAAVGLVWDLRTVPQRVFDEGRAAGESEMPRTETGSLAAG